MLALIVCTRNIVAALDADAHASAETEENELGETAVHLDAFLKHSSSGSCSPERLESHKWITSKKQNEAPSISTVPRTLLFNAKNDLVKAKIANDPTAEMLHRNVLHTISLHPEFDVQSDDDVSCLSLFDRTSVASSALRK